MITRKEEMLTYLEAEKMIYKPSVLWRAGVFERDILYKFCWTLRHLEYHKNCKHKIRYLVYKFMLAQMQNKYALHIPPNVCGKGLSIAHVGPIIINDKARIGDNLRIHVGVTIGANGGGAPVLGNNIYCGSGAKLIGEITIADSCRIGANAVVNKSFEVEASTIVGIPAEVKQKKTIQ